MSDTLAEALQAAEAGLRAGRAAPVVAESPAALVDALRGVARIRNVLAAVEAQLLCAAEQARRGGGFGTAQVLDVLVDSLPITAAEGRKCVLRSESVMPRCSLTGDVLLPVLAGAFAAGVVSSAHADVVIGLVDRVPSWCDVAAVEVVERTLVEACEHLSPPQVARMGEQLLARLDQDGPEPHEPEPAPGRALRRSRRRDGGIRWTFDTDAMGDALLTAALDPLTRPAPAEEGERDPRSHVQRQHDALVEICRRVLRSGSLPATGGVAATVLVTCTLAELTAGRGVGCTERGEPVRVPDLLAACSGETAFLPVVFDGHGAVLHLGREQRLASAAQRRALAARDRGCCFPGCDRPPSWTEAHHVREWLADGGLTDLDNLVLLCTHHHANVKANGWQLRMCDGVPQWIPPPWIDPDRTPIGNRAHPCAEFDFRAPTRGDPTATAE